MYCKLIEGEHQCVYSSSACKEGETRCYRNYYYSTSYLLQKCVNGTFVNWADCTLLGQSCGVVDGVSSCLDSSTSCVDGDTQCTGNVLQKCITGGWEVWENCTVQGQLCTILSGVAQCYLPI
jgi:hypothetical protein